MKDAERLDLLKEIGGTRVYEERRRESLKIMHETGTSQLIKSQLAFCLHFLLELCFVHFVNPLRFFL